MKIFRVIVIVLNALVVGFAIYLLNVNGFPSQNDDIALVLLLFIVPIASLIFASAINIESSSGEKSLLALEIEVRKATLKKKLAETQDSERSS